MLKKKRQKSDKQIKNPVEAFGKYITETLSELDQASLHLAQHRISNILFLAQTGTLTQDNQLGMLDPIQPQCRFFQPGPMHYNMQSVKNQASNFYPQLNVQQQNLSAAKEPVGF